MLAAFVFAGCGSSQDAASSGGSAVTTAAPGDVPVPAPYEWSRVRTTDDERVLSIDFTGGAEYSTNDSCSVRYEASVVETMHEVRVTVSGSRSPLPTFGTLVVACPAIGYPRNLLVALQAPIGDRQVINTATGAVHPLNVEPWSPAVTTTSVT